MLVEQKEQYRLLYKIADILMDIGAGNIEIPPINDYFDSINIGITNIYFTYLIIAEIKKFFNIDFEDLTENIETKFENYDIMLLKLENNLLKTIERTLDYTKLKRKDKVFFMNTEKREEFAKILISNYEISHNIINRLYF